jgi:hypothetical protein
MAWRAGQAFVAVPTRTGVHRHRLPGGLVLATNHLGHYVLTNLLWPALVAGGGAAHGMSDT